MHTARKINVLLILSYWICYTILLVEGKKYSCVLKEKVPIEEFGPSHYGELGYLRNAIVNLAQVIHEKMRLETPLRLCKLLSGIKTSYWDYLRVSYKKKTRDMFGTEFNALEKAAERVLDDLIRNARLITSGFPEEDQKAIAKVIDETRDRLIKSKTYTDENSSMLNYLNTLRGAYSPDVPGSVPVSDKPSDLQSNLNIDKYAKSVSSNPMKTMTVEPSTIRNLVVNPPVTQNGPFVPSPNLSVGILPKSLLLQPKGQPSQESSGDLAHKPAVLPSLPKPSTSPEPSSESGHVGSPTDRMYDWQKPIPQSNQEIPKVGNGKHDPSGKECTPVWVDKNGKTLGPADGKPDSMATTGQSSFHATATPGGTVGPTEGKLASMAPTALSPASQNDHVHTPVSQNDHVHTPVSQNNHVHTPVSQNNHVHTPASQNNHVHTPVRATALPGGTGNAQKPQEVRERNKYKYIDPTIMRNYGMPEDQVQRILAIKREDEATEAAEAAEAAAKYSAPQPYTATRQQQLPPGHVVNNNPFMQTEGIRLPGAGNQVQKNSEVKNLEPMSASDPVYDLQDLDEFEPKVLQADRPVFVQFHSDHCGPCEKMSPVLERLVRAKQGKVYLVRIDEDQFKDFCTQLKIESLPNTKIFVGGKYVREERGHSGEMSLQALVNEYSSTP